MKRYALILSFGFWSILVSLFGNAGYSFYPGATYDPAIPTLKQAVGHDWGEAITDPRSIEVYLQTLAKSSPRVKLVKYGESWEKRPLYYLVVSSDSNIGRIEQIREGYKKLANPQTISEDEANRLVASLPVAVWLAYSVHGNEISGADAGLLTAYHLLASQDDPVSKQILENTVVIIDPLQNPDGRHRFVTFYDQTRGRWPDESQESAEHNEPWPGGRSNHYLFDMNRDWFALTQVETRARVKAFLDWYPQVLADLHEMGSNSTYYFAPPANPLNPEFTADQSHWLVEFGKNNAAWFDRFQFDYFTREVFDSFYPGYGEGWPMFHGAIGMTYEQASTRGLIVRREDETVLAYRDAIRHHFTASVATAETASKNRKALLDYFCKVRKSAIEDGKKGPVFEYLVDPQRDPVGAARFVSLMMKQGIEVKRTVEPMKGGKVRDYYEGVSISRQFPAGTYVISLAQPAKRLVATLLAKHTPMSEDFVREQERRIKKRLGDEIYDVTAWSLPLLYDVDCYMSERATEAKLEPVTSDPFVEGQVKGVKATVAYLIPWSGRASAQVLTQLLREGVRVHSAGKAFTQKGAKFPAGTLIVKLAGNPENLHQLIAQVAKETGVDIFGTDSGWVEEGINFGSGEVQFVKKPRIMLLYNTPTASSSAGSLRYLFDQVYGFPLTVVNTSQLRSAKLDKYDVIIMPDSWGGGYSTVINEDGVRRLKDWISSGGTLVTVGEATRWLTDEKVALLSSTREFREKSSEKGGEPEKAVSNAETEESSKKPEKSETAEADSKEEEDKKADKKAAPETPKGFDFEKAVQPDKELPQTIPGAIMRVRLDTEHWLGFGYDGDANVLVQSRNIFSPIKLDKGTNVGVFMAEDKLLLSGHSWPASTRQLAQKAYLMHQPMGAGHVVAFTEDPSFRAFCGGVELLLMNAVFFGPGR